MNRCPQLASGNGPISTEEDCLYLNIYRPKGASASSNLPVFFWIYGGNLINGSINQHDGAKLARDTGVIVVEENYRLTVFGFLSLPELTEESHKQASGNYGLLDQQAALHWVRNSISGFGGNPNQITIGGESAGAWSVCVHLASPLAKGLFARAIIQSGSCPSIPLIDAEAGGQALAAKIGCTDTATALQCLRAKSADELLAASAGYVPQPVVGGPLLPKEPRQVLEARSFNQGAIMIGTTHDEFKSRGLADVPVTPEIYQGFLTRIFGSGMVSSIMAEYPARTELDRANAIGEIATDTGQVSRMGGCQTRHLAQILSSAVPTFFYQFDDRNSSGPVNNSALPGFNRGAAHASELRFLFPGFPGIPGRQARPMSEEQQRLSDEMVQYWGEFVKQGSPNAPGLPVWPRYTSDSENVMSLRTGGSKVIMDFAAEHHCAFWEKVLFN